MWRTAFALPHATREIEMLATAITQRSVRSRRLSSGIRARCNSITPSTMRIAERRKKLTVVQLEEFGFFSVLRATARLAIILVRSDRTVLIGT
jgi:hypothetical protein